MDVYADKTARGDEKGAPGGMLSEVEVADFRRIGWRRRPVPVAPAKEGG